MCQPSPLRKSAKIIKSIRLPVVYENFLVFFFLPQRGLHWPLSGLSELRTPTWTTRSSISCRWAFFLFHAFLWEEPSFSNICFLSAFFYTFEHVVQHLSTASATQHSTAQSPPHKSANRVHNDQSATTWAKISIIYPCNSLCSQNEESKSAGRTNVLFLAWSSWHLQVVRSRLYPRISLSASFCILLSSL